MKRKLLLSGILGVMLIFTMGLFTGCPDGGGDSGVTPNTPTGVSASAQSSSSIRVSWSAAPGAAGYKVYRSGSSSGTCWWVRPQARHTRTTAYRLVRPIITRCRR